MNKTDFSKWFLFFALALMMGLLISLHILNASDIVDETIPIDKLATDAVMNDDLDRSFATDLKEKIRRAEEEQSLVPVTASLLRTIQRKSAADEDPFFLVACGRLIGVDEDGIILAQTDESMYADVPVLTGSGFKFNPKSKRLDGLMFRDAVDFVKLLSKRNSLLAHQLSEVHCDPQIGLIIYLSQTGALPIFIGRNNLQQKIKKLDIFFDQLGSSDLVLKAKYVDARLNGQLVLKKRS